MVTISQKKKNQQIPQHFKGRLGYDQVSNLITGSTVLYVAMVDSGMLYICSSVAPAEIEHETKFTRLPPLEKLGKLQ